MKQMNHNFTRKETKRAVYIIRTLETPSVGVTSTIFPMPFGGPFLFAYNLTFTNIKRYVVQDVYTIFNWIELTMWTICAFRALNPHQ